MVDINFIKWMCDKAEGYIYHVEFQNLCIDAPDGFRYTILEINKSVILYPLLLQRAVEGVNSKNSLKGLNIAINPNHIIVMNRRGYKLETLNNWCFNHVDIDTAKESALRYIYEQGNK